MLEIAGPRVAAAFDGRVLELFFPDGSRRIHASQIAAAEVGRGGGLLLDDRGPVLHVRLVSGERVAVSFAGGREQIVQRLVDALNVRELRPS
jgi:hypothetical protein